MARRPISPVAGLANPIAMIGSLAMAMRYTFDRGDLADRLETAIAVVLAEGLRTADIARPGEASLSTSAMGDAIVQALAVLSPCIPAMPAALCPETRGAPP